MKLSISQNKQVVEEARVLLNAAEASIAPDHALHVWGDLEKLARKQKLNILTH